MEKKAFSMAIVSLILILVMGIIPLNTRKVAAQTDLRLSFGLNLEPGPDDDALWLYEVRDGTVVIVGIWWAGSGQNSNPIQCPRRNVGPIPPGIWVLGEAGIVNGHRGYRLTPLVHPPYDRDWDSFWIHEDPDGITLGCIGVRDWDNFNSTLVNHGGGTNTRLVVDYNIYDVRITANVQVQFSLDNTHTFSTPWNSWGSSYNLSFTGSHTFTVPRDVEGRSFMYWNVVEETQGASTVIRNPTLTLSSTGNYRRYRCDAIYQLSTGNQTGVGGIVVPVDKFGLLAPYIGLASTTLIALTATIVYVKRFKYKKQKQ